MLLKIIPLGALASTFTRQDGEVMTGDTGERPPLRALLPPRAVPGSACICADNSDCDPAPATLRRAWVRG